MRACREFAAVFGNGFVMPNACTSLRRRLSLGLLLGTGCAAALAHDGPHTSTHKQGDDELVALALLNEVRITADERFRYIVSNGIPDHEPGMFPNRGNPNTISPQRYEYRVPLHPQAAAQVTRLRHQPFGVALNGVPFDPGTAEFWRGDQNWNYEALSGKINLGLDRSLAHVQPNGAYHYHGIPLGLVAILSKKQVQPDMLLLGYAADGYPIYGPQAYATAEDSKSGLKEMAPSYRLKRGTRPSGPGGAYDGTFTADWEYVAGSGDLDECNGRQGTTPEYPAGTYYYVLTDAFPFISRNYRGTPDASFERRGPGGGRPPRPGGPGGPGPRPGGSPPGF